MLTVSMAEFQRNFSRYKDAARKQPVSITSGHDSLVILSAEDYERLKRRDRAVLRVEELSDADIKAIMEGDMDPRHDHLHVELKQDPA